MDFWRAAIMAWLLALAAAGASAKAEANLAASQASLVKSGMVIADFGLRNEWRVAKSEKKKCGVADYLAGGLREVKKRAGGGLSRG